MGDRLIGCEPDLSLGDMDAPAYWVPGGNSNLTLALAMFVLPMFLTFKLTLAFSNTLDSLTVELTFESDFRTFISRRDGGHGQHGNEKTN